MELQCHSFDTDPPQDWGRQPNRGLCFDPAGVRHEALGIASGLESHCGLGHLTVLFSDLSSSVNLSAHMDCLDYVDLLRDLRGLFRAAIEDHGGLIARLQGDGVLAIFGQDGPSEHDGYRAISCALALHAAARSITLCGGSRSPAALHTGIYSGLTYLERGDLERGRFDLIGNAPNLAARLSALAERDGIFATEEVILAHLDDFRVAQRRELRIRGWPAPVAAYAVLGHAATESPGSQHGAADPKAAPPDQQSSGCTPCDPAAHSASDAVAMHAHATNAEGTGASPSAWRSTAQCMASSPRMLAAAFDRSRSANSGTAPR